MVTKPPEVKTLSRKTKGKQVARDKEATDGNQVTNLVYDSLTSLPLDLVTLLDRTAWTWPQVSPLPSSRNSPAYPGSGGGGVPESSLSLSKPTSKAFQYTTLFLENVDTTAVAEVPNAQETAAATTYHDEDEEEFKSALTSYIADHASPTVLPTRTLLGCQTQPTRRSTWTAGDQFATNLPI
ncbi:hypothetical protein MY4038_001864 [Beauveria bassiana]